MESFILHSKTGKEILKNNTALVGFSTRAVLFLIF